MKIGYLPLASFLLFVVLISLVSNNPASANPSLYEDGAETITGKVIVKLHKPISPGIGRVALESNGLEVHGQNETLSSVTVKVHSGEERQTITDLQKLPFVEYAEPDYEFSVASDPNDPYFVSQQWNLLSIQAPHAWDITTGTAVIVAIVDTGISADHPDLFDKLVPGATFVSETSSSDDDFGHGTHVAGIAAAVANNATGIAGVSWGARLMPIKVLDSNGKGHTSDIANGIIYAADHGARVINLSLGGINSSRTLLDAVSYAMSKNVLVVAAMGNSASLGNPVEYPAAYPGVIGVAATNRSDVRASFSEYNDHTGVSAPGVSIYSTLPYSGTSISSPTGYGVLSGTSAATPHVSGLAALILSIHPDYTWSEVKAIIELTADDLGSPGWDEYYGWGKINAFNALAHDLSTRVYLPLVLKNSSGN